MLFFYGLNVGPGKHGGAFVAKSAKVQWISDTECNLTISEGKFHQVKRMFAECGNEVIYLKRIAINNLTLDDNLKSGEYRNLSEDELLMLL